MIKVKSRAKRRDLTKVFSVPLDSTAVMVGVIALAILVGTALIVLGMKNFNLIQENRWMEEKIRRMQLEIQGLKMETEGILSRFEVINLDGE
jgi:uncharacterized protein YoxC